LEENAASFMKVEIDMKHLQDQVLAMHEVIQNLSSSNSMISLNTMLDEAYSSI
jgi:hypothetical protein